MPARSSSVAQLRRGARRAAPSRCSRRRGSATVAAHVDARLVERVAERLAGVAADDQRAGLRHEAPMCADRAAHDDVAALERDAAAGGGVAVHDEQPAVAVAPQTGWRAPSTTTRARTSCSRPGPRPRCRARARSRACSCRRSSSPRDRRSRPRSRRRVPQATACAPLGLMTRTAAARPAAGEVVQALVELAQRRLGEVETSIARPLPCRPRSDRRPPTRTRAPARAPTMRRRRRPGSTAIARYSEAIATQSSVSAITAGLHAIGSRSTAKPSRVPTRNV